MKIDPIEYISNQIDGYLVLMNSESASDDYAKGLKAFSFNSTKQLLKKGLSIDVSNYTSIIDFFGKSITDPDNNLPDIFNPKKDNENEVVMKLFFFEYFSPFFMLSYFDYLTNPVFNFSLNQLEEVDYELQELFTVMRTIHRDSKISLMNYEKIQKIWKDKYEKRIKMVVRKNPKTRYSESQIENVLKRAVAGGFCTTSTSFINDLLVYPQPFLSQKEINWTWLKKETELFAFLYLLFVEYIENEKGDLAKVAISLEFNSSRKELHQIQKNLGKVRKKVTSKNEIELQFPEISDLFLGI